MSLPSVIIKLGGSLITEMVNSVPQINVSLTNTLINQISRLDRLPILVHGTGAFGKPPVTQYNYHDGYLSKERSQVVSIVSSLLEKLNMSTLQLLRDAKLSVLPVNASSMFFMKNGEFILKDVSFLNEMLNRNIIPVISGGFVFDDNTGFVVCSSDIIASKIAIELKNCKLIFATCAQGVYQNIDANEEIYAELTPSESHNIKTPKLTYDVSGGMAAKIKAGFEAVTHNVDTYIIDGRVPNNIYNTILGNPISGTRLIKERDTLCVAS